MKQWRARTGITYEVKGKRRRVEPGELVDDLPARSAAWLAAQGHIEPVEAD